MADIEIRTATPFDAEELLGIYSYYIINTAVTYEIDVPSAEDFRRRIEKTLKKYPYIVAERDGWFLYTTDAADERQSGSFRGGRVNKKKKKRKRQERRGV